LLSLVGPYLDLWTVGNPPRPPPSVVGWGGGVDPHVGSGPRVVRAGYHELLAVDHDPELLPGADAGGNGYHVGLPLLVVGGVTGERDAKVLTGPHARGALYVDPGLVDLHLKCLPSANPRWDYDIVELIRPPRSPVRRRLPSAAC
jgi:hypothetical protein